MFSCEICKTFKNKLFYRLSPVAASSSLRFPACNFVKKETPAKMFFCEFYKIFKNIFWQNTSGRLLPVFIWEFLVFQNTSFTEHLISCTSFEESEFQPPVTVRNYFTIVFQGFYTRTIGSHLKMLKSSEIFKIPENYLRRS